MFFENTPLPYAYSALEPYIDKETMELHHSRHLQTYIDNLNDALLCTPVFQNRTAAQLSLLQNRPTIMKNAGGVYNHRFYFCGMTPDKASSYFISTTEKANFSFTKQMNTHGKIVRFYVQLLMV